MDTSSSESLDVAGLTRRMVQGDETAYRTFHDAYFNRLFRYLLVVTHGDEEATREALQSTFVRVVRHIKAFPTEPVFWSWLTVLARSALADQTRKRRRYLAFLERFALHAGMELRPLAGDHADDRLGLLLEQGVASLPPDERQLVEWKYSERRSVQDIATKLQTTAKAVESRLSRVRAGLRAAVLERLKDGPQD